MVRLGRKVERKPGKVSMSYQKDIFNLIARFSGQENMLSVPRMFCEVAGSLEAGMLLSQLLYWSDKGHDSEGWFYKSYIEWKDEAFLTEYQVRKFSKQFEDAGFLEVKLKKVNGSPTLHYRVKKKEFSEWILKNLGIESVKFPNPNPKISESNNKETEITTEITTDRAFESDRARSATLPPPPAMPPVSVNGNSKPPRLPNDSFDMPTSQTPPPTVAPGPPPRRKPATGKVDGRKFKGGRIPAGQGANAVEVFYERHSINEARLSAPKEDDLLAAITDLERWRAVVIAWHQSDYKPTNIKGQLDWYANGIPERKELSNGSSERGRNGLHPPVADTDAARQQRAYNERYTSLMADEINQIITKDAAAQQWQQLETEYPGFEYRELP